MTFSIPHSILSCPEKSAKSSESRNLVVKRTFLDYSKTKINVHFSTSLLVCYLFENRATRILENRSFDTLFDLRQDVFISRGIN